MGRMKSFGTFVFDKLTTQNVNDDDSCAFIALCLFVFFHIYLSTNQTDISRTVLKPTRKQDNIF